MNLSKIKNLYLILCHRYNIGDNIKIIKREKGTAGFSVVFSSTKGKFFLRCRSREHSNLDQVMYEHKLLMALFNERLPVAAPVVNREGITFTESNGDIFEVFPWIEGSTPKRSMNIPQLKDLGKKLAIFHNFTKGLKIKTKNQVQEDQPERLIKEIDFYLKGVNSDKKADMVHKIKAKLYNVKRQLPDKIYYKLPQAIIHGDLHPGNVKFKRNKLVGFFDFDWANRQARLRDISDGIMFFCRKESISKPHNIWTLTSSFDLDWKFTECFLKAYESISAVSKIEKDVLSQFMVRRWLQSRIRGMRKVSVEERLRFLDRGDIFETLNKIYKFTYA